jgi:hypothetical protein
MNEFVKENHIEVSDGDTKLVSSVLCPLSQEEILPNQLFENNDKQKVVMCAIEGQKLEDGSYNGFLCPHFYGAVYPFKNKMVDCRNENCITYQER